MDASRNDDVLSSLSKSLLKSKISNPTRYSVQVGTKSGIVKNEQARKMSRDAAATAPLGEPPSNDFDTYMHNLKNRYVTALEN